MLGSRAAMAVGLVEARHLAVEGAFGGASLGRAFRRRLAEEDDRADELVGALARCSRQQLNLVPIVAWLDPRPWRHPRTPLLTPVSSSRGGAL